MNLSASSRCRQFPQHARGNRQRLNAKRAVALCSYLLPVACCLLPVACFLLPVACYGEEPDTRKAAKDALAKYQDALVTVKFILKMGSIETRREVEGTMVTAGGLTVVSDFMTNPDVVGGGDSDAKTETTDVKLILKDGRELAAKFVLRDRDLDVAFVQPKDKDLKLTHVPLAKTPVPEVLDDLIFLHRLGRGLNREPSVALGRVEAVVKKPQTFVVPDLVNGLQNIGCPAFDGTGRCVGIVVMRRPSPGARQPQGLQDLLDLLKPVILPAEDLEQTAGQVTKP